MWISVISRIRSWNFGIRKYKGRVVLRGDIVKDDFGACEVFTEQGSSASQMTAAKIMDIISRLPGCDGQAADAGIGLHPSKNGRCSQIIENSQIGVSRHLGFVYHDTNGQNHGPVWKDPVVPLERNLYGHPLAGLLRERQYEKNPIEACWEKVSNCPEDGLLIRLGKPL